MAQYLVNKVNIKQNALYGFLVQEFVNNDFGISVKESDPIAMGVDSVYSTLVEKINQFYLWNQDPQNPILGDRIGGIPNRPYTLISVNTFGYPTNSLNQLLQSLQKNEDINYDSLKISSS